ncbi:hypothetical protein AAHN93_07170 [Vandammella animalimorsus]|uniref:Uncharacterized protein n=1 Tax=Vandammella animalimorsus TaxID=2029117 RepID=A0A2A2B1W1_9BURK|nr:hypothetical protein [Vandammella animalimorsus]PAT44176.1 hypothetical protein CK621_00940 [Vandammella animalimorsus]
MIGLLFLGAGLAWLAFSCYMAVLVAKDAAIRQPFLKFLLGGIVLSVMLVGPFLDHIIGMRQFKKLCDTQTGLHIFPGAANATQGKEYHLRASPVNGVIIAIEKSINEIIDVDTGEKIAEYNYFSTRGGGLVHWLRWVMAILVGLVVLAIKIAKSI